MTAQDVIAAHAQRYDEELPQPFRCLCGWTVDDEAIDYTLPGDPGGQWDRLHAAHVLDALNAAGYAVVKLPAPTHIRVSAIDMNPEYDDPTDTYGPRVECRFTGDLPKPGRLFDRAELAAALLAAAAHAEDVNS